ncbi:MAG: VCBS repeat-containing protein [Bacteroidetes bacterium]|nr:VCBS repeat-containing protein [Bacteroidota bacterium]
MRKVFLDTDQSYNSLCKLSFYSPSQGFVAFSNWIGFTSDSGRTFIHKTITFNNVNFNGYSVNLTFGFDIMGIKSFDQNTLIVYGNYGSIPAILYSLDGGNTFKLVFHSQINPLQISLSNGVADMDFVANSTTGFAVDEDRILKTTDQGQSWSVLYTSLKSYYNYIQAFDANTVYAGATYYDAASKLQKTINGGVSWQTVSFPLPRPDARLTAVYFLNANTGWIVVGGAFYKTVDGGGSWVLLNNTQANPFPAAKMKFFDNNLGFAVDFQNTVYKTSNGGAVWEPLPRDNNVTNPNSSTNDLQLMGSSQLWAGWAGLRMLELSIDAGGIPLPKSFLYVDTVGLGATGNVKLTNYSAAGYTYRWLLNGVQISTAYNSSYVHDRNKLKDTVTLIVSNGTFSDTATAYAYFNPPLPSPTISSFSPSSGATGDLITVLGANFYLNSKAPTVTIGGVPAAGVYVYSSNNLGVIVGAGASGNIVVTTAGGSDSVGPFTYIPPPVLNSFSPASAALGDTVTIYGRNFTGATAVSFGDTAASYFTVLSDTVIKAVVWIGASGAVKVKRPSGTGQANGFIFIPPPPPVINTLSTFTGTPGTPVKIIGVHFYGTISVKFGGVDVHSFRVVSDSEIDAIVGFSVSGNVVVTTLFGSGSIGGFSIIQPPVISSFSPDSGPVGTSVTITGTHFNPVASQNIVYFGSVRGIVTTATDAQITVQVPYGANFQPISVTVNNLTAYSQRPFLVASPGSVLTLTDSSFAPKKDYPSGSYYMGNIAVADFDGDGRPDLANSMGNGLNVSVLRNLCSPGTISFDAPMILATDYFPRHVTASDVDGDGKLDLVVSGQNIGIFKNTSSAGHISFAPVVSIKGGSELGNVAMSDLNGDGKPDMVTVNLYDNTLSIYGNISTLDSIAFTDPIKISYVDGRVTGGLAIGDVDGDGKADIAAVVDFARVRILRNTSTNGALSFAQSTSFQVGVTYGSGSSPTSVSMGDLDGDGKTDLAVGLGTINVFSILRNISTPGNVAFEPNLDFSAADNFTKSVSIEDMDGDGKPDVTVENPEKDAVSVYKNISTPGHIAFNTQLQYPTTPNPISVTTGDLDLDGRPDIFTNNNEYPPALSVLRNKSVAGVLPPVVPANNYKVQIVNNVCRGKAEGKIIVTFTQEFGYKVRLTADGFADSARFTGKSYERDSLVAGVYTLCFTIDNLPGYQQCFTVNITQPKDLAVLSAVSPSGTSLTVSMDGSDMYYVNFNGAVFQTTASNIDLPLQAGANTLSVQTPLSCQGVITRTFLGPGGPSGVVSIPNPVTSVANLYVPGGDTRVRIEVFSLDGRRMDGPRTYDIGSDRSVKLNMTQYKSGLYLVHIEGAALNVSIKLIKL